MAESESRQLGKAAHALVQQAACTDYEKALVLALPAVAAGMKENK